MNLAQAMELFSQFDVPRDGSLPEIALTERAAVELATHLAVIFHRNPSSIVDAMRDESQIVTVLGWRVRVSPIASPHRTPTYFWLGELAEAAQPTRTDPGSWLQLMFV